MVEVLVGLVDAVVGEVEHFLEGGVFDDFEEHDEVLDGDDFGRGVLEDVFGPEVGGVFDALVEHVAFDAVDVHLQACEPEVVVRWYVDRGELHCW